jgi:crotonobetainyl-CoA:carnitine CoA-transferase CaiB-like acyl-CoA transferase
MMADMGAEVIRVEWPKRPDMIRQTPPFTDQGESVLHRWINRGKRCLAVDMAHPDTREILVTLARQSDVVIEQFKPGVMARYGLDYDSLKQEKPDLVFCSLTGYGQTGPLRDRAGHDINYMALAGAYGYSGKPGVVPHVFNLQIADLSAGHHALIGILAALFRRQQTGEGSYLDIALHDAALSMNGMALAAALGSGQDPQPAGDWLNGGGIYGIYPTLDGKGLAVGSLEPQFARKLEKALDLEGLTLLSLSPDPEKRQQAKAMLSDCLGGMTLAACMEKLGDLDACIEPVLSLLEAARHPHTEARQRVARDADGLEQPAPAIPCAGDTGLNAPGGRMGQHSRDILVAAGFDESRIQHWMDAGVVAEK